MADNKRGQSLGKAAIARTTRIGDGTITTVDRRVSPMVQILGITFDANNNIIGSTVIDEVNANTAARHLHSNLAILDATTASFTTAINDHINNLETRLAALELTLANHTTAINDHINNLETRLATLELALANYATHTHNYNDGTIADTAVGGSAQIDTIRTTTGVN